MLVTLSTVINKIIVISVPPHHHELSSAFIEDGAILAIQLYCRDVMQQTLSGYTQMNLIIHRGICYVETFGSFWFVRVTT